MSDLAERLIALSPRLRRYARGLTGDAARADDLTQDTLERAWRFRLRFQLSSTLGVQNDNDGLFRWLLTIMHRLHLSAVRRPDRVETTDMPPEIAVDDDPSIRRDLLRALASLPDDQRKVLLLVGLEQLAYREAAVILGVPLGTVMSRLSRARERMRAALEGTPVPSSGRSILRRVK
ncbi:RNA polymerase sigma factor [Burkholderia sp. A9]|uniref:RNA polymerase sigma factor n=1 Tax=Burkholderia sp. A9 TaxID=1365108 RepID=UPI0009E04C37|nr:RNA polymerase sigma factor [Burkholderia sp. A9]